MSTIRFRISEVSTVTLKIYNLSGQEVKSLIHREYQPGDYFTKWDGTNNAGVKVSSGIYIYRIKSSTGNIQSRKMLLLK